MKRRSEFEGFVSFVNKKKSKVFNDLVANAERFIPLLTWGKNFELDTFTSPDYTSLDILTFACSGTPLGINIPNYNEIRENVGFKNVYLANTIPTPKITEIKFLNKKDATLYCTHFSDIILVKVALHELLGHGTGKLLE